MNVRATTAPVELADRERRSSAVIGLWGPRSRQVLQGVTDDDVSNGALPFRSARDLAIGPAPALAQRITYVGELGYELYVPPEVGGQAWDRLLEAGQALRPRAADYRVLDSLRMEKGYRYFGTDLTALDTPDEAGLGFCVAPERKGDFLGRTAIEAERSRPAAGGSDRPRRRARLSDALRGRGRGGGRSRGRAIRSCAYSYTVGANRRLRLPRRGDPAGARLEVDVFGHDVPAEVTDVLYDPGNERILA